MSIDASAFAVFRRGDGAGDYSKVDWMTFTTTSQVAKLPTDWGDGGYWIHITALDADAVFVLSNQSDQTAAASAGSEAGTQGTTLGDVLIEGVEKQVKVPPGCVYLARICLDGSSSGRLVVALRSDPLGAW